MDKKTRLIVYTLLITLLLTVVVCTALFVIRNNLNKQSEENFAILSTQRNQIIEDFDNIYSFDNYTISSTDDGIKVSLKKDSNVLNCYFDENFNIIKDEYGKPAIIDNYLNIYIVILALSAIFTSLVIWSADRIVKS